MKTTHKRSTQLLSQHPNQVTIQTLRNYAGQFLHVADVLEATDRITSNGGIDSGKLPNVSLGNVVPFRTRGGITGRRMSAAARKKISQASKARWAQVRKTQTGKAAAA